MLHEVPPQLMTVTRILGWDTTPGLVLHERAEGRLPRPALTARPTRVLPAGQRLGGSTAARSSGARGCWYGVL